MNNFPLPSPADFYRVMPELIWCGFGVLLMLLQPLTKNRIFLGAVAFVGASFGTMASVLTVQYGGLGFFGLVQADTFSLFFLLLVGVVARLLIRSSVCNLT